MKIELARIVVRVLCCLSCLLFLISKTNAATFVVNDTSDRVDSNPGNGVCRTSAGTCTLRAAIQEANARSGADIIRLPARTFRLTRAPLNQNDIATGDLDITAPVTIQGAGADVTILDGGTPPPGSSVDRTALDRLFEIHPTAGNVTISGLTIRKGWDQKEGGALYNTSPGLVRLVGVKVLNSTAPVNGGAIYHNGFAGGTLVIERSTISGNATGGEGGGIYMPSGTLSVIGTADLRSTIANNIARNGGGIYNGGSLSQSGLRSRVELAYTTLSGNTATNSGGGIDNDLQGDLVLADVIFSANAAGFDGGALSCSTKSSLSVIRGTFLGNTADGNGGAVFTHAEEPVTIEDSVFASNGAGAGGGALSVDGKGTVNVTDCTFSRNTAVGEGGAIAVHSSGPVEITDCTVSENAAQLNGGGVLNSGFVVTFTRLIITGNTALGNGGGIDNQSSSDFVLLNPHFISNVAGQDGGGLHNTADGPLWISDASFVSNRANNGGGLHNEADKPFSLSGSTFWDNRAAAVGGGLVHSSDAPTGVLNCTLSGNVAGFNGGGLYLDGDAGLHVINTTITRNTAPHGSGVGTADAIDNFPIVSHPLLLFRNTIVAGNLGGSDCHAAFGSEGGNLDGGSLCNFQGPRDRANVIDPGLAAIADNGGPTLTHALLATSPGVGGGVEPCPQFDQRGILRELDRPCDIGAYEFPNTPEVPTDLAHPETMLDSGPSDSTENFEAIFAFSSNEPGSTFGCSLDGAAFVPCISPLLLAGLIEGLHSFQVRATDPAGNTDPTPASFTWTIELSPDITPPETAILSNPPATTESTGATFTFGSEPGATFECSLDGVSAALCSSPVTYIALSAGVHTFTVSATDMAGNHDPTPASYTWTVTPPPDTTPPETLLTAAPELVTTSTDAMFVFSANEPGSVFECAKDNLSFNDCVSPVQFTGLSVGVHSFAVRAIDPVGNVDPTPTIYTWTINPVPDTTPPETLLASGPATPTDLTTALFTFSASESGSTFQCALDGGAFTPCVLPAQYADLRAGDHIFEVRAIDPAGNIDPTPATFIWTIELAPPPGPETTILSGPPVVTESTDAMFTFTANQPGATFECALDGGGFVACVSGVQYMGLAAGDHIFEVIAIASEGNADSTPASYSWTVLPPCGPPMTLMADADAWIDENSESVNKGSDSILKVQSKGPRDNFRALVRFALPTSLPAGCAIESATLRLYAASAKDNRTIEAVRIVGAWGESSVSWVSQPPTAGPAATASSGTSSGYLEWNVTVQVLAMLQAGANHGFMIRDASEGESGIEQQFHSREKGENVPELIISFAPAP